MSSLLIDDERIFEVDKIVRTYDEGILALQEQTWTILYLDHDLGDPDGKKTGYGILCWLEQNLKHLPKKVILVTNNAPGRQYMSLVLRKLYPDETPN